MQSLDFKNYTNINLLDGGTLNFVSKFDADLPVDGPGAHPSAHAHIETVSPKAVHQCLDYSLPSGIWVEYSCPGWSA